MKKKQSEIIVVSRHGRVLVSRSVDEQEILKLKAQLAAEFQRRKAEYERESEALDTLLIMLRRRRNGASHFSAPEQDFTPEPQPHPKPDSPTGRSRKARGLLYTTRAILDHLPDPFTTLQLKEMLERTVPEFAGKVKMDSLRGTLKQLADEGRIQQIAEGAGPRPALYKHLKKTVEAGAS